MNRQYFSLQFLKPGFLLTSVTSHTASREVTADRVHLPSTARGTRARDIGLHLHHCVGHCASVPVGSILTQPRLSLEACSLAHSSPLREDLAVRSAWMAGPVPPDSRKGKIKAIHLHVSNSLFLSCSLGGWPPPSARSPNPSANKDPLSCPLRLALHHVT